MSRRTTDIWHKDMFIRSEGLVTLREYVNMGRVASGQRIMVGEVDHDTGIISNTKSFWIGDCTPKYQLTDDYVDPRTDWMDNAPYMDLYVLEVHSYLQRI